MANGTLAASQIEMLSQSGTGIITITPPATNTNRAITLPDAAGAIVVSGTTPSLNGITFPATQVASAGANTLDDYEEGTWTPVITAVSGTYTAVTSSGTYTKIGKAVVVKIRVVITTNGTAAVGMLIGGFPFAASDGTSISGAAREDISVGYGVVASPTGTTTIAVNKFDATYGLANGHGFTLCIAYIT